VGGGGEEGRDHGMCRLVGLEVGAEGVQKPWGMDGLLSQPLWPAHTILERA
jgi:hypothetical protein